MSRRVRAKWRPPLALVLGGTLTAVFLLPILAIGYFRVAGGILGWGETTLLIGAIAAVATSVLGWLLWRLVLRPVRRLTAYAKDEGAGRAPTHFGTPEFSALGQALLEMTARLRGREAVLRSYADHVTHELKSPLTSIQGAAELLDNPDLSDTDRQRLLDGITGATARMQALLDSQRALAKAQEPMPPGRCSLSVVLQDQPAAHVAADAEVPLPAEVMALVATHLIGNALAHGATKVTFSASPDALRVSDNGPGVSPGNRDRIFDPFFTTRRDQGGTGMGLPIVQRMLQAQGADIRLLEEGLGAVFEIRF